MIELTTEITNNSGKSIPLVIHHSVQIQESRYNFTYAKAVTPQPDKTKLRQALVLEEAVFLRAKDEIGGSDGLQINVKTSMLSQTGTTICDHSDALTIDKETWILAQQENNKPKPEGEPVTSFYKAELEGKIKELEEKIATIKQSILEDPLYRLQQKIFHNQMEEIKNYLMNQSEMQELALLKPIMEISKSMKIGHRWSIAVAILSSLEGFMKNWLVENAKESIDSLKKKDFGELIDKMENSLKSKGIKFEQKKLSDLSGKRNLRNKILHEMYEPTEGEIKEITEESIEFVKYMESLTNSS